MRGNLSLPEGNSSAIKTLLHNIGEKFSLSWNIWCQLQLLSSTVQLIMLHVWVTYPINYFETRNMLLTDIVWGYFNSGLSVLKCKTHVMECRNGQPKKNYLHFLLLVKILLLFLLQNLTLNDLFTLFRWEHSVQGQMSVHSTIECYLPHMNDSFLDFSTPHAFNTMLLAKYYCACRKMWYSSISEQERFTMG